MRTEETAAGTAPPLPLSRAETGWQFAGSRARRWKQFSWAAFLWALVYPPRGHRILPTVPGLVLIALAVGIGMAAYNTANNILFITLSLLLSCLILNGVLSWFNFFAVSWRLRLTPPVRVGEDTVVSIELRNSKRVLPTYGLWFDLRTTRETASHRLFLRSRLEAGETTRLDWIWRPERRGLEVIELAAAGSLFPFGFLRKQIGGDLRVEAVVWPAPVSYRRLPVATGHRPRHGVHTKRTGHSSDLLALRRYAHGDSHRLIHWKASARLRQLLVREFAAEAQEGVFLWLETPAELWPHPEQFELLCGFAASLAEDFFRAGRLKGAAVNTAAPVGVRRVRDLETVLDQIALVQPLPPVAAEGTRGRPRFAHDLLTFAPDGSRRVTAYLHGEPAATA